MISESPRAYRPNTLRIWLALYTGHRRLLLASALIFLIKHSPAVLLPVLTGLTIDALATHAPLQHLAWLGLIGCVLIAQNLPGHWWQVRLLSRAVRQVEHALRSTLAQQIQQLSIGCYERNSAATLQTKMLRDVEAIEQMTRSLLDGVLGAGSAILVALITTAWRAPQFLFLFLLTVPLACALVLATRTRLASHHHVFRLALENMSGRVGEMTQMLPLTRAHALESQALARVEGSFEHVSEAGLELDSVNAWFNGLAWVGFQGLNLGCLMAAAYAYRTQAIPITMGDVVLLSTFFTSLTNAVLGLAGLLPQLNRGLEAIVSLEELLREPDLEHNDGKPLVTQVAGKVVLESVAFRYAYGVHDALTDISLQIEPGQTVALVGASGSGKSTLVKLVIGLLRPSQGRVLLDGVDMQQLDMRSWRRHLAVVPQDAQLFDGSVRDNVCYGIGDVSEARIYSALRDAHCLEFIAYLPQSIDTVLGHGGSQLSGGQRQRLAIARALIRDPRVLVLDEPSSALDGESERLVQQALERLRRGRTTLIVAHRLSTIQSADRIAVMEKGCVVDIGSHVELLKRCPAYIRLYANSKPQE